MKGIFLAGGTGSYQLNTETLNTKVSVLKLLHNISSRIT